MNNNTISNWDDADPKTIYTRQLLSNPLYWDETLNLWVAYSYDHCKAILLNENAHVPEPVIGTNTLLSEKAVLMLNKLARVTNNKQHAGSRQAAMMIFNSMKSVSVSSILEILLVDVKDNKPFDWVAAVGKKLPASIILKGLGFDEGECAFVVDNISSLIKIISPNKTIQGIELINSVIDKFYSLAEQHVKLPGFSNSILEDKANKEDLVELFVCNLLGLFIQCYDAGRGLLCNTLISFVQTANQNVHLPDISHYRKLVIETLRFDPPVHNTRRIAIKDILAGNQLIKAGEIILVVLAAANLDPQVFKAPELFDLSRNNNDQNITFGLGRHNCIAKYTMIDMAAETCLFLNNN
jgi:cytochrome P450